MTSSLLDRDRRARARALAPDGSFIVQAPAGSGKTELLTQRLLKLLSVVEYPEEVVAITFTNKAAGEMANRVLEALRSAAENPEPGHDPARMTWNIARQVLRRDRERNWNLQDNPRRLRIQTIDSLCASLARQMPVVSRLGARHTIAADFDEVYLEAARAAVQELESGGQWSVPVRHLLAHLDNNLPRCEQLLAEMLARRDQWLRHIGAGVTDAALRARLEGALSETIRTALGRARDAVPVALAAELAATAAFAAAQLEADGKDHAILACRGLTGLPGIEPEDAAAWVGLYRLLCTKDGWRKNIDHHVGMARKAIGQERYNRAQALLSGLRGHEELRVALAALESLPGASYSQEQWQLIEALHAVLPMAVAQLWLVFRRQGELDYTEVQRAAVQALGEPEQPTDLALALDYRIRHILVDEFQDTSLSQFDLLRRLTAGWTEGDGHTLFAVGDPMQSVYRFRQAEVGLFLKARRHGVGNVRLEPLNLAVNFRSCSAVIDWVNAAFARVLPARDEEASGAVSYAPCVAPPGVDAGTGVSVHALAGVSREHEAQLVVDLVRSALAEAGEDEHVAVLVRARTHLTHIVPLLRAAGVRFRAVEIEALSDRQVVQDLHALARALAHPADRVAWLAVLRAPWCGLSLADLHAVASVAPGPLWPVIESFEGVPGLSEEGRRRLARARGVLRQAIGQRGRHGLRRRVEGAWLSLGGPACVEGATDIDDALVYLDLLERTERAGDIEHFGRLDAQVAKLFAQPDTEASDRLQIMTIHKAKGLEFDTVIIPALDRSPPADRRRLLAWVERARGDGGTDLLLAPIPETGEPQDPVYRYLRALDQERGRNEDARLLYVGATRAIRRLHLVARAPQGRKSGAAATPRAGTLLAALWPVVAEDFARAVEAQGPETAIDGRRPDYASVQGIARLPADFAPAPPPPAVTWDGVGPEVPGGAQPVEFSWAGRAAMHVGTVVHEALLRIAADGAEQWNVARVDTLHAHWRRRLQQLGVEAAQNDAAVATVRAALAAALERPRGQWVLGAHAHARSEYSLSGIIDGRVAHVTLDRTFVDTDGTRWIIDYKTGMHEGGDIEAFLEREKERYRDQLERYGRLVATLDSRPIRLGLYYPLLDGWREWAFAPP